jgi:hypothetical protein
MNQTLLGILIMIISLHLTGCASVEITKEDKQAAKEVIRQFELTQSTVTYRDPSSFARGDQYMTPEFAEKYHGEIRAEMEKFLMDSRATVSGTVPTITFIKQEENSLLYNLESHRTITTEISNAKVDSHVEYIVTVTKQNDGTLLINNLEEPK